MNDTHLNDESNRSHFTDEQCEIIEVLILRQIAAYNQRLFKAGVVSFEYKLSDAQQKLLDECGVQAPAQ